MKKFIFLVLGLIFLIPNNSEAQSQRNPCYYNSAPASGGCDPVTRDTPLPSGGSYFTNIVGSTTTRATNTTTYTANTTVCANTATTVCVPGTIQIANANAGKGLINRVTLLKSSSTTANANFIIWFYSAAPVTATPSQFDNVSYTGPRAADMPNYIGNAACSTPVATSDTSAQTWFECTLSNPNTSGVLDFQSVSGVTTINYLISVTAAYAPANAETFTPYVSGLY